ncbi:hypothetical protein WKG85_08965 [Pantoea agglomerans]|uniref:hypothetical protein n=1 Tax=Enterobacter agglomerans TaxID=549 RepID=UPI003C7D76EA
MSTTRIALIKAYQTAIISIAKHGTLKNARSAVSAAERAAGTGCVYTWGANTKTDFLEYCAVRIADLIAHDHAEALEMDKQATHFRKEQDALTKRVAAIMGKGVTPGVNKAPV